MVCLFLYRVSLPRSGIAKLSVEASMLRNVGRKLEFLSEPTPVRGVVVGNQDLTSRCVSGVGCLIWVVTRRW